MTLSGGRLLSADRSEAKTRTFERGCARTQEKKGDILGYHLFLALRAIDGARTRGLDLGKVARYQLRHYRILSAVHQRLD